jgi:hypothetical protein
MCAIVCLSAQADSSHKQASNLLTKQFSFAMKSNDKNRTNAQKGCGKDKGGKNPFPIPTPKGYGKVKGGKSQKGFGKGKYGNNPYPIQSPPEFPQHGLHSRTSQRHSSNAMNPFNYSFFRVLRVEALNSREAWENGMRNSREAWENGMREWEFNDLAWRIEHEGFEGHEEVIIEGEDVDDWNVGDYFQGFMEEVPEAPEGMEWLPAGSQGLYQLHPKATNPTGVSLQAEHLQLPIAEGEFPIAEGDSDDSSEAHIDLSGYPVLDLLDETIRRIQEARRRIQRGTSPRAVAKKEIHTGAKKFAEQPLDDWICPRCETPHANSKWSKDHCRICKLKRDMMARYARELSLDAREYQSAKSSDVDWGLP